MTILIMPALCRGARARAPAASAGYDDWGFEHREIGALRIDGGTAAQGERFGVLLVVGIGEDLRDVLS